MPEKSTADTTQVADAIYRSEFGKSGSSWHTLLGTPSVLPTVSVNVPSNQGFIEIGSRSHARIGLLDYNWFSDRLNEYMRNNQIDPHTLVIFLVYNVFLYTGDTPAYCCVLGYHGATTSLHGNGAQQVNMYMFTSYSGPGIVRTNPGDAFSYIQDIDGLSHEVQEWTNDPFLTLHTGSSPLEAQDTHRPTPPNTAPRLTLTPEGPEGSARPCAAVRRRDGSAVGQG